MIIRYGELHNVFDKILTAECKYFGRGWKSKTDGRWKMQKMDSFSLKWMIEENEEKRRKQRWKWK